MGFFQKIKETFVGKSTKQNENLSRGLNSNLDEIKKEVRLENIKDPHAINDIIVDKMFVIYANDSYMTTKINYAENDLTVILMVGVNGAGKTTLIRHLVGVLKH